MAEDRHDELALWKSWRERAREQTLETLPAFLDELAAFEHDYGTIAAAIAAGAYATAAALDRSPRGGITGFQASFVMWRFIEAWQQWSSDDIGRRLQSFDDLLYPQMRARFLGIPRRVWDAVQEKAASNLASDDLARPEVRNHWRSIVGGVVPFGLEVEGR